MTSVYHLHQLSHVLERWEWMFEVSAMCHCVFLQHNQVSSRCIMQNSLHQNKAIIEMDVDVTEQFIFLKRVLLYRRS